MEKLDYNEPITTYFHRKRIPIFHEFFLKLHNFKKSLLDQLFLKLFLIHCVHINIKNIIFFQNMANYNLFLIPHSSKGSSQHSSQVQKSSLELSLELRL